MDEDGTFFNKVLIGIGAAIELIERKPYIILVAIAAAYLAAGLSRHLFPPA